MSSPKLCLAAISEGREAVFACYSDTATVIFLAGSFNDWSSAATPMTKEGSGDWSKSLPLAPGRYEYKYVVDGEWWCAPGCTSHSLHCTDCVKNDFGTMNRVLEV